MGTIDFSFNVWPYRKSRCTYWTFVRKIRFSIWCIICCKYSKFVYILWTFSLKVYIFSYCFLQLFIYFAQAGKYIILENFNNVKLFYKCVLLNRFHNENCTYILPCNELVSLRIFLKQFLFSVNTFLFVTNFLMNINLMWCEKWDSKL